MQDVAYLAGCAVNGIVPDKARIDQMDYDALYRASSRHLLEGITAMALESAGVRVSAFTQAKGKAIRKVTAFDIERSAIIKKLETAGIWYLPLKGAVLASMYPKIGMRQMADNDILYDASRTDETRRILEELGYTIDRDFGKGIHDHYFKPPVCNFEMHRMLFWPGGNYERMAAYYQDVRERLIQNGTGSCGYHFSDDDFYIYMIIHEYKHYSAGGTGLRSILDTYVYCQKKGRLLDWQYIAGELEKLGIAEFEKENRSLAFHLFGKTPCSMTERDKEIWNYVALSGTYGTVKNRVQNNILRYGGGFSGKTRYVFGRLFLPFGTIRTAFPVFAKYPFLLPLLPLYRIIRCMRWNETRFAAEIKALFEMD